MRYITIAAALMATITCGSLAAERAPDRYALQILITRADVVIAAPHLVTLTGETATLASDDGQHHSWTMKLRATPGNAIGHVAVDWSMSFKQPRASGEVETRSTTATMTMTDPGHAALDLPSGDNMTAPLRVELTIAKVHAGD